MVAGSLITAIKNVITTEIAIDPDARVRANLCPIRDPIEVQFMTSDRRSETPPSSGIQGFNFLVMDDSAKNPPLPFTASPTVIIVVYSYS
jgi:hypothetical protein